MGMISYLPTIQSFWSCALASKTYKYLSIYLGRYLHNKFFASLLGIVLNCVFKVFPFILVISVYDNLKRKKNSFCYFNFFLLFHSCGELFLHPMHQFPNALIIIIMLEIVLKWDNFLTIIIPKTCCANIIM